MTTLLKDDVVLITGGGSGLGAGVARHCLAEGAKLAIMDISGAKLDSLRSELGDEPLLFQGDATRLADLQACREAILGRFGRLNAFIGAQGIWDGNVPLRDLPMEKLDEAFDEIFHQARDTRHRAPTGIRVRAECAGERCGAVDHHG